MKETRATTTRPRPTAGIATASALAIAVLLLSLVRIAGDTTSAAFKAPQLLDGALSEPIWQSRLGTNIALFVLAIIGLHLGFAITCWLLARVSEKAFPQAGISRTKWVLVWVLGGTVWLFIANATLYPHSSLGEPYRSLGHITLLGVTPLALATLCLAAAVIVVTLRSIFSLPKFTRVLLLSGSAAALLLATGFRLLELPLTPHPQIQPNVILIGVDSLRPDVLNSESTPAIRDFLDEAIEMTDAITPLARTFPSWVSVLTGRHPHTTGAFMNLLPRELIQPGETLPDAMRNLGYRTIYAIDETRFSNIDNSYGFDHTVTPTIGSSDFVLTWFADTPLSNLVIGTRLGGWLFPHVHTNRAAHTIYNPEHFVRRVVREIPNDRPFFLAAHLTLPHWPFSWATSASDSKNRTTRERYMQAVERSDRQFAYLIAKLQRRGILDNALVIVLSDHGEAIGPDDEFLLDISDDETRSATSFQRSGHGTSVFSPRQYRVVLGIRAYGPANTLLPESGKISAPVSLVDIAPTILDLLEITPADEFDGVSLAPLLRGEGVTTDFATRIRFTESEYNPQGFEPDQMTASALTAAAEVYRIDPTTDRLEVRPEKLKWIMANRQFAAILGSREMAAAIPNGEEHGYDLIYIPDSWSAIPVDPHQTLPIESPKLLKLRQALEERFLIEITPSEKRGARS